MDFPTFPLGASAPFLAEKPAPPAGLPVSLPAALNLLVKSLSSEPVPASRALLKWWLEFQLQEAPRLKGILTADEGKRQRLSQWQTASEGSLSLRLFILQAATLPRPQVLGDDLLIKHDCSPLRGWPQSVDRVEQGLQTIYKTGPWS